MPKSIAPIGYSARKRWDDLSCVHRNWRGSERLRSLHGYARSVEIEFHASHLDDAGVIIDFSSMKSIKALLERQFDHTVLVAQDDPLREEFERLASLGLASLRVMEDTSLEGSARWIHDAATPILRDETSGRVRIGRIEVRESAKNAVTLSIGT